jgi:hypothetical protein
MNIQYVYLIQTEKFVKSGEPVYKIGKTKQLNYTRFRKYDKGSIQLYQSVCKNCDDMEKKIIELFNSKYERHSGKEYFKGNYDHMLQDISELVETERLISGLVSDIVGDIIENIVDIVVEETIVEEVVNEEVVDEEVVDEGNEIITNAVECLETRNNTILSGNGIKGKFSCSICDYNGKRQAHLTKHLSSDKHKLNCQPVDPDDKTFSFHCNNCNKKYKGQSGLWHHTNSKVCIPITQQTEPVPVIITPNEGTNFEELLNELKKHIDHTNLSNNELFALELRKLNERFDVLIT